VKSTAILVRWLEDATVRPFPLDELLVITGHTGDEYADTYSRDQNQATVPRMKNSSFYRKS
jgi:hypothetical protein